VKGAYDGKLVLESPIDERHPFFRSCEDFPEDVAVDVCQAEIAAAEAVGELFMIHA
jgi:hypothetical protein